MGCDAGRRTITSLNRPLPLPPFPYALPEEDGENLLWAVRLLPGPVENRRRDAPWPPTPPGVGGATEGEGEGACADNRGGEWWVVGGLGRGVFQGAQII